MEFFRQLFLSVSNFNWFFKSQFYLFSFRFRMVAGFVVSLPRHETSPIEFLHDGSRRNHLFFGTFPVCGTGWPWWSVSLNSAAVCVAPPVILLTRERGVWHVHISRRAVLAYTSIVYSRRLSVYVYMCASLSPFWGRLLGKLTRGRTHTLTYRYNT